MKIILLEDIKGLGKKFEAKEIKDGYAKNFLIPKNLAKPATESNLKILSQQKTVWERKEKETLEHLEKIADQLKNATLDFYLKVGESGQIFGSVSAAEIIKTLKGLNIFEKYSEEIKNFEVMLEKPIKELGERLVEMSLGKGIKSKIKIKVHSQP